MGHPVEFSVNLSIEQRQKRARETPMAAYSGLYQTKGQALHYFFYVLDSVSSHVHVLCPVVRVIGGGRLPPVPSSRHGGNKRGARKMSTGLTLCYMWVVYRGPTVASCPSIALPAVHGADGSWIVRIMGTVGSFQWP